ncbi:phage tail tube protein [Metapseudomonas furukawaii]|uniref:phage tail tube protein n=1 Tax=Metapseudomonas furukawaii TaxID=1149133 RepID=UPI00404634FE
MADLRGAFLGVGKIYLEDLDEPKGLIQIGNTNSLTYEAQAQEIEEQDYTTPGGGLDASVQRISAVNVNYNARHFKAANMARAMYGNATDVAAGTVTGEEAKAWPGALVALAHPGATSVVITPAAGGAALVAGTDYNLNAAGFPEFTEEGAVTAAGMDVEIDYSYAKHVTIQALVKSGKRYRMVFIGLNEARSGKPVVIEVFRVNHSPASLGFIGDEFQGMEFTAKCEKDPTKTGTGVSQYLVIKDVD